MPKILSFKWHTTHTERNIETHRHMLTQTDTDTFFLHFTLSGSFGIHANDTNFIIFGIPQTYTCTDTQTCTHIDTHM